MGTDRARNSYDATRHYRSIVAQQGRVTVEADFNEGEQLRAVEARADLTEIIGPAGTPDHGFAIKVAGAFGFSIHHGTIYVGGVRITLDADETYEEQKETEWVDAPSPDPDVPNAGPATEIVYLELTEQEVSAVEDPALREVALGGPDTAGRTRMIQRVRRAPSEHDCEPGLIAALAQRSPGVTFDRRTMELHSKGRLVVDFVPVPDADNLCQPIAQAGFLGAENQLIRVQVTADGSLLWGYDNASFLYRVKSAAAAAGATTLELEATPVDEFHRPRPNQWVEVLRTAVRLDADAFVAAAVGEAHAVGSYDSTTNTIALATTVANATSPKLFARIWEGRIAAATTATELVDAGGTHTGVRIATSGTLVPGDYWMIGVRPTHPDQVYPARLRTPQPPDGPARWATPLATIAWMKGGKTGWVHDCRRHFKPLIDDDDLAFHNKHLHGWGVVCGLQVRCMPPDIADRKKLERPREWVDVFRGYAIDPEGHDIRLHGAGKDKYLPLDVGELAVQDGALTRDANGTLSDGSISLWIDRHRGFHVDKFEAKTAGVKGLLEGTLLLDIYNDCILNLIEFVRGELTTPAPGAPAAIVSTPAKRLIAVLNIVIQLANIQSGKRVYISQPEHDLLKNLYDGLIRLLASKSFCGLYDDAAFPTYDIYRDDVPANAARPTTLFGTGRHTRLRINSARKLAHTCGNGASINTYDLATNEIVAITQFPVSGAQVQDVAFSRDGRTIYAAAWIGTAQVDSLLMIGTIETDGSITWSQNQVQCSLKVVTLATDDAVANVVYAAARGSGVYAFDTATLAAPRLIQQFSASGHLVAMNDGDRTCLYAGEHSTIQNPVGFDQIRQILPASPANIQLHSLQPAAGTATLLGEDIAIARSQQNQLDKLYAIFGNAADSYTTRTLASWDRTEAGPPTSTTDLGASRGCRIAYAPAGNWSMITYEETFEARTFQYNELDDNVHPLQIAPVAVASDRDGQWFYALEWISNTITAIPATAMDPARRSTVDLDKLMKYRRDVIAAFLGLLGRFAQYLKDCICDHLLVDCPDGRGKKVYLADISFKDGAVYQICNFHNRRYVHTFPTVEYWMSIVPILPLIKRAVETVCCSVLGNAFDRYVPKTNDDRQDKVSAVMIRNGAAYVKDANLATQYKASKGQALAGVMLAKSALAEKLAQPPPGKAAQPSSSLLFLETTPEAAAKLADSHGVTVSGTVSTTDKLATALKLGLAAPTFARGDKVDLITDPAGKVVGIQKAAPASTEEVASLRKDLADLREAHAAMLDQMKELQAHLDTAKPKKKG